MRDGSYRQYCADNNTGENSIKKGEKDYESDNFSGWFWHKDY